MKTRTKIMAVFFVSLALCSICLADELLVPSQYPTIQAAIDDANDGDTVLVADGTYTGQGNRYIDFLGKAITVRSENGPENCIIDCNGIKEGFYFHQYEDANSVLDGFTITNGIWGGICCKDHSSPTISNCIISGNLAWWGGGISCEDHSRPTITSCTITGNIASEYGGGGIYCYESSPKIINCNIIGNSADFDDGGGICCEYYSSPTITSCTITGNTAGEYGGGIYCEPLSRPKITNSIFWNNAAQIGAEIYGSGANVTYSDVRDGYEGEGNINADPLLTPDGHLQADSPCIDAGDPDFLPEPGQVDIDGQPRIMGGRVDMGVDEVTAPLISTIVLSSKKFCFNANEGGPNPEPQILSIRNILEDFLSWEVTKDCPWLEVYPHSGVSTFEPNYITLSVDMTGLVAGAYNCTITISSPNAANSPRTVDVTLYIYDPELLLVPVEYPTIQSAINAAVDGNTVIVTPGTYTGEGNRDINFLGKAITVRSENGPENCIIDCNGQGRGFYFQNNEDANSVLDGFTITNANRGAIYCYSSPTIANCIISGNAWEHGIYCYGGNATITSCTITDNIGSGIHCETYSSPTIANCIISGNSGWGRPPARAGGIYCGDYSSPTITNCIISGNKASWCGGGIYCYNSSPMIIGCIITGHAVVKDGGGIYCYDSSLKIINCTITDNSAKYNGGGIFSKNKSSIFVTNSIAWGNTDSSGQGQSAQIYDDDGRIPDVWFSCIQDSNPDDANIPFGGEIKFNIDYDPCFVSPGYWDANGILLDGDYHLLPTSPCIDTGDLNYIPEPNETDLDGNPRVICERIDMGAYEYTPDGLSIAVSAKSFYFTQDWPKPEPQTLLIRSCGGEPLHWEIVEDCNWLDVSPANGVYTDQINEVTITVDPNGLTPAVYTCSFEVRDPNASNSPVTVRVTMPVGMVLRVPSQDFDTIQAAIDAADNYDIVLVADGNYTGEGNKNLDFRGKTVTVRSENGPNNCIIDCENSGRGFYFQNQETKNSVVNGFTITNAYIDGGGGGIYCYLSSPTIRNCIIANNSSAALGGGMLNLGTRLRLNRYYCNPTVTNCTFTGNSASFGGGMCNSSSSPTVTNCTFTGNSVEQWGGGMSNNSSSSPTLTNCTITGNSAGDGGGMFNDSSSPTLTNCTITGNSAGGGGGGMFNDFFSSPTLTNCVFSENFAKYYGGGMWNLISNSTLTNCILWDNTAGMDGDQIALLKYSTEHYPSTLTISYSDVEGGLAAVYIDPNCSVIWGLGNIDDDPCFVWPGYWADVNDPNIVVEPNDPNAIWIDGDYHLLPNSPCIDAGDPNYIPEPNETDLDGNPRINGGRIDMGAYESIMHEARLWLWPQVINRKSRQPRIMAWLHLPQGITKDQIDKDVPLILYPGGIKAVRQFVFQNRRRGSQRTSIFAFFDKAELMDAIDTNGPVQLQVFGHLLEPSQYFYGSDTIRIIARRLPRLPLHRARQHRR